MSTNNIKPCPFCGGKDIRYMFGCSQGYMMCGDCEAEGPKDPKAADPQPDVEAAFDAWNRRTADLSQPSLK